MNELADAVALVLALTVAVMATPRVTIEVVCVRLGEKGPFIPRQDDGGTICIVF